MIVGALPNDRHAIEDSRIIVREIRLEPAIEGRELRNFDQTILRSLCSNRRRRARYRNRGQGNWRQSRDLLRVRGQAPAEQSHNGDRQEHEQDPQSIHRRLCRTLLKYLNRSSHRDKGGACCGAWRLSPRHRYGVKK